MPHLVARLSLALAATLVAACAAGAAGGGGAARGSGSPDSLVSSLEVETFPDSVRFVLRVTNVGAAPVALEFPSGQSFDFVVSRDGRELWRWSADRMFTQALRTETLAPGETREFHATWQPPAGTRGELVARGFLTAPGHTAEQQTRFRLP